MSSRAILAVRLFGFFLLVLGALSLLANAVESARDFDPTYLGYYLVTQTLRPGLAMTAGILGWRMAPRLGRWLARGLDAE